MGRVGVTGRAIGVAGLCRGLRYHRMTANTHLQAADGHRAMHGMTKRACRMASATGRVRMIDVAFSASSRVAHRLAAMGRMAIQTSNRGMLLGLVARRTSNRDGAAGQCTAVNRMTADALPRCISRMRDQHLMTTGTRPRRVTMRQMTRDALRVRLGREHGLILVTARAREHLGLAEVVRLMATGALRMTNRQRLVVDMERLFLRRMTAHATHVGAALGLMHIVAIETASQTRVLGLLSGVTLGAWRRVERRRFVRVMAAFAGLIRVRADRMHRALLLPMALHARRRRSRCGAKAMAVLTTRRIGTGMQRRCNSDVALRANFLRRRREACTSMAFRAGDFADVRGVARAVLHHVILGGTLLRRRRRRSATCGHHQCDDRNADHGLLPMAWHKRHGIELSGKRLDHPGGCGLPPTPPTLWQLMHNDCPAPS